jgi:hypothetical protein
MYVLTNIIKYIRIIKLIIKKSSTQTPPNLSGTALIKPKNVRKNHSGMILSLVFKIFTISKLSS